MIKFLKRVLLLVVVTSNPVFAGNICNVINYLGEFHSGTTFSDSDDDSFSVTLNTGNVSQAYFYYKGNFVNGKYSCSGNTFYFIQEFSRQTNIKFKGELIEKAGEVLAFSSVEGSLNDQPLPPEFKNLHTEGFSDVSCNGDMESIQRQIARDGTVTTHDGQHTFNSISHGNENKICYGDTYYGLGMHESRFVCSVKWEKGNWGNTLSCI